MPSWAAAVLAIPHLHWIIIVILVVLFLVSVFGNIGIDWKEQKFTFGSKKQPKVRTCGDCIKLLMAKRTGFEVMYNTKHSSVLRQQMVFAEHKIIEIEQIIKTEVHINFKDEVRRSFKENGFNDMNDQDYNNYIEERVETLSTLLNSADIKLHSIIKDIYDNAKAVKSRIDLEIKKLEDDFIVDIDNFTKEAL
jgi:hypothetical protein